MGAPERIEAALQAFLDVVCGDAAVKSSAPFTPKGPVRYIFNGGIFNFFFDQSRLNPAEQHELIRTCGLELTATSKCVTRCNGSSTFERRVRCASSRAPASPVVRPLSPTASLTRPAGR